MTGGGRRRKEEKGGAGRKREEQEEEGGAGGSPNDQQWKSEAEEAPKARRVQGVMAAWQLPVCHFGPWSCGCVALLE